MAFDEYDDFDAVGLAELVRRGDVTPHELLDAAVSRMEARNPALNAVVYRMVERARKRVASLPDGPLKGVPFMVKDLKLTIAGTPTSNSTKLLVDVIATRSSVLAERYEAAGLQIIGKTNTPEFGIMGITEPELRGPARNPWNPDYSPGGSSGGSASAVAARMVPAAHSGDGGGSIRIPASCCGLFGLKPTRGRVTMAPWTGEAWSGFVQEHVVTRSVRDSAAFLDISAQPTLGEPYAAPAVVRPFAEEVGADPGQLRFAFTRDSLFADNNHADCVSAVDDTVELLRSLGHEVVEAMPPFNKEELVHAYFVVVAAGVARMCEIASASAGRKPRAGDFEPSTWVLAQIGWKSSAADLVAAQMAIQVASRGVAEFFQTYDGFVSSTIANPPARVGELAVGAGERRQLALLRALPLKPLLDFALKKMADGRLGWTPNTQLFNQTGQPAMSVPLFWNAAGLPIGTQIVGRFGDEAMLFRLAAQLEEARPWAGRKPSLD
ncbi:MAG: amidase [Myxococcota bacterium]|jgi:amidase